MRPRHPQPERTAAKFMALSLFLCICIVVLLTHSAPTSTARSTEPRDPSSSTWIEEAWDEHQDVIQDAAVSLLLGGV